MQGTASGARDTRTHALGLSPGLKILTSAEDSLQQPLPIGFPPLHLLPSSAFLSFVASPTLRVVCALQRLGLVQAEHAGFGEQSRVWFQHLIQFVLPRLKYEMVASQTFKGQRRESERLLKFKF